MATACQKETFSGRSTANNYNADCRSNPYFSGDLFSWCAVARFADQLCPYPWRVPTRQDFIDLDIAMGGTGSYRADTPQFVQDNYITRWGGHLGGFRLWCHILGDLEFSGGYWSQSLAYYFGAYRLGFHTNGNVWPINRGNMHYGLPLRCVR